MVTISGNPSGAICGIVTKRDYARKVILQDKISRTTTVCEIMTADVMSTTLDASTDDCMAAMTLRHFRHLPVSRRWRATAEESPRPQNGGGEGALSRAYSPSAQRCEQGFDTRRAVAVMTVHRSIIDVSPRNTRETPIYLF